MTKLYDFQKKGVRKIEHFNGRALLADEMGLGKTIQALTWLHNHPELRPALILCPANIKWVWEFQAAIHVRLKADVLQGRKPSKKRLAGHQPLLVLNYEILKYWVDYLKSLKPKAFIIDECHYIKNLNAQRTREAIKLSREIPHIIAASGTPLTNRPYELFPTLHILRPDKFPSCQLFGIRYCKPKTENGRMTYKGATNLKELHYKLNRLMMIRRLKVDVMKELPPKTRQVVPLDIDRPDEYRQALKNFLQWLGKQSKAKAAKAAKAQRLVQMGYLKRLAAELKLKAVTDWVDSFLEESDGKLVIYCCHKKVINRLYKRYKKMSVIIQGETPAKARKLAVKNFQRRKKYRLFIGNIRAAGVGITLTAASDLAFAELDWVPGNHTQAEDRIHRISQKNAAMIYYLVAKNTIEELLCKIIQKKQKVVSQVLDGQERIVELDVFNMLEKELRRQNK